MQRNSAYKRDPEQKRSAIAAAALDLFLKKGYEHSSTAEIAKYAGTSEGTLFNHFQSKRKLFEFLARDYAQKSSNAIIRGDEDQLTVELVVRRTFDFCDAHDDQYRLFSLQDNTEPKRSYIIEIVEKRIAYAMTRNRVRLGNPRIMAELQFAIIEQSYSFYRRREEPSLREAYIQEAVSAMNAILAP